jgi:3-deoxy-manno-octulosonate cytidylyltransferase (CMP-KDO synthetase)
VKVLGLIPARYASGRFPGKPLIELKGKPMIQRVWERAMQAASLDAVAVATDDLRIKRVVEAFGGTAVMTPVACASGTDRIAVAVRKLGLKPAMVVNIQGDEPLLPPAMIDQLVAVLKKSGAPMATLCRALGRGDLANPNAVKVVMDKAGRALYFSRAAIPHARDKAALASVGLHVGLYAYRAPFLQQLARLKPTPLEKIEKLEQLRVLENGFAISVGFTRLHSQAVDTPADAQRVRRLI